MRPYLSPILGLTLIAGFAQAQLAPGLVTTDQPSTVFDGSTATFTGIGATQIMGLSFYKLATNTPGTWTACLTTNALSAAYGGSATQSIVMGIYDMEKKTFTPDKRANALNTSGNDFGLHISKPLGRYAVLDHPGGPMISERLKFGPTDAFPAPTMISGAGGPYVDPAIGRVNSTLMLFWVDGSTANNQISMAPLVKGASGWSVTLTAKVLVAKPIIATNIVHSPSPITDAKGEVIGLIMAERAANESNIYFKDSLDVARPHILLNKHTYWQNNGGITGGRFHWADASSTPTAYYAKSVESKGSWIIGGTAGIGQTISIHGGFDNSASPFLPNLTLLMASLKIGATPIPIPGMQHALGLDLKTIFPNFGMLTYTDKEQRGVVSFPVPNDKTLVGTKLFLQGLSIQPKPQVLIFSNTTELNIK